MKYVRDDKKQERISVRFTNKEAMKLKETSAHLGITLSEYVRATSLQRRIHVPKTNMTAINELRRLGGLIKHLYTLSGGVNQDKTRLVLDEIISAIKALSHDR